jgi:hypothetical protein
MKKTLVVFAVWMCVTSAPALAAVVTSIADNFNGPDDATLYDNTGNTNWMMPTINNPGYLAWKQVGNQLASGGSVVYPYALATRNDLAVPNLALNEKIVATFKLNSWTGGAGGVYWRFGIYDNVIAAGAIDQNPSFYIQNNANGALFGYKYAATGGSSAMGAPGGLQLFDGEVVDHLTGGVRLEVDATNVSVWFDRTGAIPNGTSTTPLLVRPHGWTTADWNAFGGGLKFFFYMGQVNTPITFDDFSAAIVVPEPATISILSGGLLLLSRRKK